MNQTTNDSISIRMGKANDAPDIAKFTAAIAAETECLQLDPDTVLSGVANAFASSDYGFYAVAECDAQIAGCLMVTYEWSDWRNGVQWWLQSVYVDPNFRRQGVFSKLYSYVIDLAKTKRNVCGVRLYVNRNNAKAIATYTSLGMQETNYLMLEIPLSEM